jgi:glycerophosphoryl diester phosphodiesterase
MDIIGHRGCAAEFPENTLAAVRGCAEYVDMIEIDVRRCQSGELIVFHDDSLDRLTEASGPVGDFAYRELTELTIGGSEEPIPLLTAVLDELPEGVGLNIELKETGLAPELLALRSSLPDRLIISSFDPSALDSLRESDLQTGLLSANNLDEAIETAVELGCEYLHPEHSLVDSDSIRRAHERGLSVNAWTVPTERDVRRLRADGVDGVIVDSWTVVPGR